MLHDDEPSTTPDSQVASAAQSAPAAAPATPAATHPATPAAPAASYRSVAITAEQFEAFSDAHPLGNFQQSPGMMRLAADQDGHDVDLVGIESDGELRGAAMMVTAKSHFGNEGSIWLGPLVDGRDPELVRAMTAAIEETAKSRHAYCVTCWPADVYRRRTSQGEPDGEANNTMMDNYAANGWQHHGFTRGYGEVVNRWVYVKDLTGIADDKALLKSYDKRTQWSVKRAQSMGVHVREIGEDEFDVFARIERQTAERRSFKAREEAYFHRFKKAFGGKAHFMLAEIHIAEYVADMEAKRKALREKVAQLQAKYDVHSTTRTERQLGEESRNLAAAEKRLAEAEVFAKDGDVLPAAASLFVEHPQEMVYLFSGSVAAYKPFYASALIQYEAMRLCLERGITRYNFYGISGVFDDPHDEGRGVLEFKQGFNGYVEELAGRLTLPVNGLRFHVSELAHKLLGR
ncbi:aminoacyltransferase [Bifidobacterium jacchi]|uniref:Aminoacyltransferase n=2 Tax=Bifidobacterium jacchi TaxID=2490545 RepID=A0A5N5RMV2_9BIFI|nr:aminoacyltransferase [Bifidobacterium jacchi]